MSEVQLQQTGDFTYHHGLVLLPLEFMKLIQLSTSLLLYIWARRRHWTVVHLRRKIHI